MHIVFSTSNMNQWLCSQWITVILLPISAVFSMYTAYPSWYFNIYSQVNHSRTCFNFPNCFSVDIVTAYVSSAGFKILISWF